MLFSAERSKASNTLVPGTRGFGWRGKDSNIRRRPCDVSCRRQRVFSFPVIYSGYVAGRSATYTESKRSRSQYRRLYCCLNGNTDLKPFFVRKALHFTLRIHLSPGADGSDVRYRHPLACVASGIVVARSRRSDSGVRREGREREKNKVFFFCSHLFAPSPRSERLEQARHAVAGVRSSAAKKQQHLPPIPPATQATIHRINDHKSLSGR